MTNASVTNLDFDRVFDLAPVMITAAEAATGRVVACSQKVVETTGFSKHQIIGRQVIDLVHTDFRRDARELFGREIAGEPIGEAELQLASADGGRIDVSLQIGSFHEGAIRYQLAAWQDISARKNVERTLRQSQHKLQAVLDNSTAVIYLKYPSGRYLLINRRFEELFGISREDIRGKTDHEVFPREQADAFRENDESVLSANQAIEFEEVAPHPNGLHTYISLKFPIHDDRGRPCAVGGISTDITQRTAMERALKESEERFRQLAENIHECVWIAESGSWKLLYVSPAFERVWGRPCNALEQYTGWMEYIHRDDRDRIRRTLDHKALSGDFDEEYRVVFPDGSIRWVRDRRVPICDEAGDVYRVAGITEDISRRKQLEKEVSEISSYEQHRISRELHDGLGQQLTGLAYLAKSLTKRLAASSLPEAQSAETIREGVRDALGEVRRVVRGLAPVCLDAFGLKTALEELADSVGRLFAIPCEFHCPHQVALSDNHVATQLYRIAQEALNNAVKHAQANRITIDLKPRGRDLTLQIRDDGCGIAHDCSKEGMGLQIMKYRAAMIGAVWEVVSAPGKGTVVTCTWKQDIAYGE